MSKRKLFLILTCILYSSTAAQAMYYFSTRDEEEIDDKKRKIIQSIKDEIPVQQLEFTEHNQTQCQLPDQKRVQHNDPLIPRFGKPIAESLPQGPENWKETEECKNQDEIRKKVPDTSQWPYCAHGVVEVWSGNSSNWGTGTMIGPNLVLTAAHNLYNTRSKQKMDKVFFIPARNGQEEPFGRVQASKFYITKKYEETVEHRKNGEEDYGLLVLDQDLSPQTGYFGLNILSRDQLKEKRVTLYVVGYPGDKVRDENGNYSGQHQLWRSKGKEYRVGENYIYYKDSVIRTYGGNSGGGVYYRDPETQECFIVGVHVHGTTTKDGENDATFLTQQRFEQIQEWIAESKICEEINLADKYHTLARTPQQIGTRDFQDFAQIYGDRRAGYRGDFMAKELRNYSAIHLKKINLRSNHMYCDGIIALSQIPLLQLEELDLKYNWIGLVLHRLVGLDKPYPTTEGIQALVVANWPNLKRLKLRQNAIQKNVAILAQGKWPHLQELNLENNGIGDEIQSFCKANWPDLEDLDLRTNCITHKGMVGLCQAKWKNLRILKLGHNYEVKDQGIESLKSADWKNLEIIDLDWTNITTQGVESLRKASWPRFKEIHLEGYIGQDPSYWTQLATIVREGFDAWLESRGGFHGSNGREAKETNKILLAKSTNSNQRKKRTHANDALTEDLPTVKKEDQQEERPTKKQKTTDTRQIVEVPSLTPNEQWLRDTHLAIGMDEEDNGCQNKANYHYNRTFGY